MGIPILRPRFSISNLAHALPSSRVPVAPAGRALAREALASGRRSHGTPGACDGTGA